MIIRPECDANEERLIANEIMRRLYESGERSQLALLRAYADAAIRHLENSPAEPKGVALLEQRRSPVDRAKKAARDKRHNAKPQRKKYLLGLSRRWQKKRNDQSKRTADYHYRRWDEVEDALVSDTQNTIEDLAKKLGRTRHAIQTRRKKLKSIQ